MIDLRVLGILYQIYFSEIFPHFIMLNLTVKKKFLSKPENYETLSNIADDPSSMAFEKACDER